VKSTVKIRLNLAVLVPCRSSAVRGVWVGVYYRLPDQEEEVYEAFSRQLKLAS